MDLRALHTLAPAVDHPHAQDAFLPTGLDVLRHHGGHVAGGEGMEVQLLRDGHDDGVFGLEAFGVLGVFLDAQPATSADSASSTGASHRSTSRASAPLRRR